MEAILPGIIKLLDVLTEHLSGLRVEKINVAMSDTPEQSVDLSPDKTINALFEKIIQSRRML